LTAEGEDAMTRVNTYLYLGGGGYLTEDKETCE
jgi:hypothetical protein